MKTIHLKLGSIQQFFYEVWLLIGNGHQTMTFEEDSVSNKNVNAGMRNYVVHTRLLLVAGNKVKCAMAAYLPEERGAQDSTIYLVGVAEQLTVVFHLFIGFTYYSPIYYLGSAFARG